MSTVFPTCLADTLRPRLAATVRALLARRGVSAEVARGTTCCGQPAYNAGYATEARRVARPTLRALARRSGPIVVPSGSCAAMMAHHWPTLFAGTRHEAAARDVARRVVELSQALTGTAPPGGSRPAASADLPAAAAGEPVAYHGSCHLVRELGVRDEPVALLAAAGCDVRRPERADLCCGFGGTFSVKLPDVSVAMADEKLDHLVATGASVVTGCDLSCLVHLEGRARARGDALTFRHLAEQIAESTAERLDGRARG